MNGTITAAWWPSVLQWAVSGRAATSPRPQLLGIGLGLYILFVAALAFLPLTPSRRAAAAGAMAVLFAVITVGLLIQRRAALSQHNYRTLFDSASDAMLLVDYDTLRILEANPAARRLSDGLVGQSLRDVFPELRDEAEPLARVSNGSSHRELRRSRPDGQAVVYEASANLLLQPQGPVLLVVARDITERKQTENILRSTNQQLEMALAELRQTQAQVVQQERLRALGAMASGVAHDFNNALAKILGYNELLLRSPEHLRDPARVEKYLHMVSATAHEAVKIVNRLREFYRSRQDTEHYEPVRLDQLVEQAIILTQPKWKDQMLARGAPIEIELDLQPVPFVRGNAGDLREVVINLTFNAVDAMPAGGRLTYRTYADGSDVVVEVGDTGGGMSAEVRRRCYEPFFTTKTDGSPGLGLAIVYGIVNRHAARIDIRSSATTGTTVAVRVPSDTTMPVRADAPAHAPAAIGPLRILVVDDEPLILDIEREYLSSAGHTVETALDGREGLEKFRVGRFDLVMLDRAMPGLNGEQVATAIKETAPTTPIILVTGFTELLRSRGAKAAAVDLVVAKPFTQAILQQALVQAISAYRSNGSTQSTTGGDGDVPVGLARRPLLVGAVCNRDRAGETG